jgi:RNA polymerase sigma-70 factor (ECF subfamily)
VTAGRLTTRYEATIRRLDATAFDALVRAEGQSALRVATVVLGTPDGADDVVQIAMERAWSAIATYDEDRPFRPWFLRIVANTARNDRRQRGRQAALRLRAEREPTRGPTSAEEAAITAFERRQVLVAVNRLDIDDRTVIALRYFEQLGEADMAVVLGCAPGTVKSRLARARARLREQLEAADG